MSDITFWGYSERSTYHTTRVNRVASHLRKFCTEAGKERKFVPGRITDAWGYDKATKTIYLCEIKVNPKDLLKAVSQIHDTVFKFKPKDLGIKVIPVIAVPKRLYDELVKYDIGQWRSFRSLCKTSNIAIWIIEQSAVQQIQGPTPKTAKKHKPTTKVKTAAKYKTIKKAISATKPKTTAKGKTSTKPKTATKAKETKKLKTSKVSKTTTKNDTQPKQKTRKKTQASNKKAVSAKTKVKSKR